MSGTIYDDKILPALNFYLNDQSVLVSEETGERRSRIVAGDELPETLFKDANTLYEAFRRGARMSSNGDCLGIREKTDDGKMPYVWIKYDDAIFISENIARGMLEKVDPGQNTMIGIYSTNRPEWIIVEHACYVYSMVSVPLYDTLGLDACAFILNQTEIQLLFVDKSFRAETLIARRNEEFPMLRTLVMFDTPETSLLEKANKLDIEVIEFKHLEELGRRAEYPLPDQPPSPDDLATVCYSSGTTGMPKGAMLTHRSVMADLTAYHHFNRCQPNKNDTLMSYLPLAHMFERVAETLIYIVGGRVGFYRGDIKLLVEDIQELKPTLMPTVPRLLNRVYDKVMQEVNKCYVKRILFWLGTWMKMAEVRRGTIRNDSIWDTYLFKKIQASMGGRLRAILIGSAPLSEDVTNFCRATMGCLIVEGYGQTECVAAVTITIEGDWEPCQVGPPIPCCKIKMVDVPEMNYFAKNGCGEVCVYGPNVMKGYYKNPEETAKVLDAEGWLHTGDIGQWTKSGTLKLIDRKKHIFKLSQGEYIAPEKVETVYSRSQFVAQCFVYGESLRSSIVAVVVPNFETLIPVVQHQLEITTETPQELCKIESVKSFVFKDMQNFAQNSGLLHSFEQIKAIHLHHELFSVENGLLTPTFKSKRKSCEEFFKQQIAQMYESISEK